MLSKTTAFGYPMDIQPPAFAAQAPSRVTVILGHVVSVSCHSSADGRCCPGGVWDEKCLPWAESSTETSVQYDLSEVHDSRWCMCLVS